MMKNLIIRLDFVRLRNETHIELNENVIDIIEKFTPQTLGIVKQYAAYKPAFTTEISLLDVIRKSPYTHEIQEGDRRRNEIYRGFIDAVKSLLHHFDAAKRSAAAQIEIVMEHYGNVCIKTYDQKTAAIDDFIREFSAGNYSASISALALNDWLTALAAENQAFKNLMTKRYDEVAHRPATVRMVDARAATDKALRAILYQIEAMTRVNGEAQYRDFISKLNAVFKRYKDILAQRKGRRNVRSA
ncbi:MAG: DUF6261 family protein [Dysgonamonadaceae bacterium]|jgi:hypothetical protein|nr:DUF6261 family protein [Dysgonamonadaceae bacterium]